MPQPRIAAIVLQYGNWEKTAACIESLLASSLAPEWIILLDNASPDDSAIRMEEWLTTKIPGELCIVSHNEKFEPAKIVFIKREKNDGYAGGNNMGIKLAQAWGANAFLILNNDAWLTPNALGALWERLSENPANGLCGPLLAYPGSGELVQCCAGGHTNYMTGLSRFTGANFTLEKARSLNRKEVEKSLNFICGACALVSADFVKEIGMMDERFFLYCEEQDWALRAGAKFNLVYAPDALVFHHEGAATGWNRFSFQWLPSLQLLRSRLRLAWMHHPYYLPTVFLACIYAAGRLFGRKLAAKLHLTVQSQEEIGNGAQKNTED